jgi:hypothetical protein
MGFNFLHFLESKNLRKINIYSSKKYLYFTNDILSTVLGSLANEDFRVHELI